MSMWELATIASCAGILGGVIGGFVGAWLTSRARTGSVDFLSQKIDAWGIELRGRQEQLHAQLGDVDRDHLEAGVIAALDELEIHDRRRSDR